MCGYSGCSGSTAAGVACTATKTSSPSRTRSECTASRKPSELSSSRLAVAKLASSTTMLSRRYAFCRRLTSSVVRGADLDSSKQNYYFISL